MSTGTLGIRSAQHGFPFAVGLCQHDSCLRVHIPYLKKISERAKPLRSWRHVQGLNQFHMPTLQEEAKTFERGLGYKYFTTDRSLTEFSDYILVKRYNYVIIFYLSCLGS